jgi:hypothetical protein
VKKPKTEQRPTRAEIFASARDQLATLYSFLSMARTEPALTPEDAAAFVKIRRRASAVLDAINAQERGD